MTFSTQPVVKSCLHEKRTMSSATDSPNIMNSGLNNTTVEAHKYTINLFMQTYLLNSTDH